MLKSTNYNSYNLWITDVEKNEQGQVWALWGFNIFNHQFSLWNIPELKAYNEPSEVDALVSKMIAGLV